MTRYLTAIGAATLTLGPAAYMTIGGPGVLADQVRRRHVQINDRAAARQEKG